MSAFFLSDVWLICLCAAMWGADLWQVYVATHLVGVVLVDVVPENQVGQGLASAVFEQKFPFDSVFGDSCSAAAEPETGIGNGIRAHYFQGDVVCVLCG